MGESCTHENGGIDMEPLHFLSRLGLDIDALTGISSCEKCSLNNEKKAETKTKTSQKQKKEKEEKKEENVEFISINPVLSFFQNTQLFRCNKYKPIKIKARRPLRRYSKGDFEFKDFDDDYEDVVKKSRPDTNLVLLRIILLVVIYYTILYNVRKAVGRSLDIPELM